MATLVQIHGMLLEEAILCILRHAGYKTIEGPDNDPSLCRMPGGLGVRGRGGSHQIDAIGDFLVYQPFTFPQRLLVEGKCWKKRVDISIVRNAVGILRDVSEYWLSRRTEATPKNRCHYQFAIFSASEFTREAQRYAFAQDIYLVPLGKSQFFGSVVTAIRGVAPSDLSKVGMPAELRDLRAKTRAYLRTSLSNDELDSADWSGMDSLTDLRQAVQSVREGFIALADSRFPLFLVPNPARPDTQQGNRSPRGPQQIRIRISYDKKSWYLTDARSGVRLYSFDLPRELFEQYAPSGSLSRQRALDLKEKALSQMQAVRYRDGLLQIVEFVLDRDWISEIRSALNESGH